ncbi:MAG: MerR family transcriptional regulator, thiopeptide resistance regulator [Frankiaceae bacterium]|nr:MerR family transcriptional regulator, thiopeptide resistance regulator [Frankiaceae bacterium]
MGLSIGDVARTAHVTVRALHHYDAIGLLSPSERSAAGYRSYSPADIERLQQIVVYRSLGMSLQDITAILDDHTVEPLEHLRRQHALLVERSEHVHRMIAAIDKTMEAHRMGINLTPDEQSQVFGAFAPASYADEVEERWGETDAFAKSKAKTSSYTKADWAEAVAEQTAVGERFAALLRAGAAADSQDAMDAAEAHRRQITRWYYDCSYEIQTGLADMYLADPRFTENYENIEAGLAQYVHDAIHANAIARA